VESMGGENLPEMPGKPGRKEQKKKKKKNHVAVKGASLVYGKQNGKGKGLAPEDGIWDHRGQLRDKDRIGGILNGKKQRGGFARIALIRRDG